MARYVTSGAQYNPFDFNAMWKSAEAATQAHYAQAAQFATMAEQMAPMESLKYNTVDANDYAQVQQYNQQLNDALNKFQKNGLGGGSFQNFLQLSKDYATKIKPLEIGLQQRANYDNIILQMKVKDPSIETPRLGKDIALSEFARGSVIPKAISGVQVQQEVAQIAAKFAQQSGDNIDIQSLNKYYDVIKQQTGLTFNEVMAYMKDPNNSAPKTQILNSIVRGVLLSKDGFNELSPEAQQRISQYAMQGAWNAVGTTQNNVTKSNYFDEQANARGWAGIRMAQEEQDLKNEYTRSLIAKNYAQANNAGGNKYDFSVGPIRPYSNITGTEHIEEVRQEYDDFMQYKRDVVKWSKPNHGGLTKKPSPPKAFTKSGLRESDYERYITEKKDNTVYERQRYQILPNSDEEKDKFYGSFFGDPNKLDIPITRRGGNSKTTLRDIIPDKILNNEQAFTKYMRNNFAIELNYGTADPEHGLIIRNTNNDAVYYMPYSAFGSDLNNLVNNQLKLIKMYKAHPTLSNDEKETMITSAMGWILNDIYSTTKEPKQASYKVDQTIEQ